MKQCVSCPLVPGDVTGRVCAGMKKLVVDLLLSYNPQWLRLGLEVVYGELVPVRDVTGISSFLMSRLLTCPDIAAKYAHPTVPHLFADGKTILHQYS